MFRLQVLRQGPRGGRFDPKLRYAPGQLKDKVQRKLGAK